MTPEERRSRAQRFEGWYERDGLKDVMTTLRGAYIARIAKLEPHDRDFADKAKSLATAARVVDQVESAILAIIKDGVMAVSALETAERVEKLGHARRKFF